MEEFQIKTPDGLKLHGVIRTPDVDPKACVSIVHGTGEHSGRYEILTSFLNRSGFATAQIDLRGHGQSDGIRGHSPSYDTLLDDIGLLLFEARNRFPYVPHFLLGHSMGGVLALNFWLKRKPEIAGIIALSPGLRTAVPTPKWKLSLARFLVRILPSLTFHNGLKIEHLTRNMEVIDKTRNDPLYHFRISARLGLDVIEQGEWALNHASEWNLPLLLMHGTGDLLTSFEASREFSLKAGNCTFISWEGLYHELYHEPERDKVLAAINNWLISRLPVP